jgi:hypothetical protein
LSVGAAYAKEKLIIKISVRDAGDRIGQAWRKRDDIIQMDFKE